MAVAQTRTFLSLDRFAQVVGINPLHFSQVFVRDIMDAVTCDTPVMQYSWQTAQKASRESVAESIAAAEDQIVSALKFNPLMSWTVEEEQPFARPANPQLYNGPALGIRAQYQTLRANKGYIISGGQQAKSLIVAATPVTYSDNDGDGYKERASIGFATTVTDPQELAVYYPGQDGADEWEIRPMRSMSIAGGIATLTMRREQLVLPNLLEVLNPSGVDGSEDANFLTTLDVYRKYNDPSVQSQFIWNPVGGTECYCSGESDCPTCGFSVQNGCLVTRNPKLGIVAPQPGSWNGSAFDVTSFSLGRSPDRVRLWYRSGYRKQELAFPLLQMDPMLERAIAYLALANMQRPFCACEPLEANTMWWREELAHNESTQAKTSSWQLDRDSLRNPFGTTRGARYAWNIISGYILGDTVPNL